MRTTLTFAMTALAVISMHSTSKAADIRLCTGSSSGVYYAAGDSIKTFAGQSLPIKNVETGGTIDNLERLLDLDASDPKACDAMIGQPDGPVYISRQSPAKVKKLRKIADLHREYLHVLCNKASGVDDLKSFSGNTKYTLDVGVTGSGAWLIWQNIVSQDSSYADVPVKNEGGMLALSSVAAGDTTCMLAPSGLRTGIVMEADNTFGDQVVLAAADSKTFVKATDIKGEQLYSFSDIPKRTYGKSLQTGFFGGAVSTIGWNAAVYVNTDRVDPAILPKLIQQVSRAALQIKAEYGSK